MARAETEKIRLKWIIKTYILLKGETTVQELHKFFVENDYRFIMVVTPHKLGALMKDNKEGILKGLQSEKRYLPEYKCNANVYYYE